MMDWLFEVLPPNLVALVVFLCGVLSFLILFHFWRKGSSRSTIWERGILSGLLTALMSLCRVLVPLSPVAGPSTAAFFVAFGSIFAILCLHIGRSIHLEPGGLHTERRRLKEQYLYRRNFSAGLQTSCGRTCSNVIHKLKLFLLACFFLQFCWFESLAAASLGVATVACCLLLIPDPQTSSFHWISFCVMCNSLVQFVSGPIPFSWAPSLLLFVNGVSAMPGAWACLLLEYGGMEDKIMKFDALCTKIALLAKEKELTKDSARLPLCSVAADGTPTFHFQEALYYPFQISPSSVSMLNAQQIQFIVTGLSSFLSPVLASAVVLPYVGWVADLSLPLVLQSPAERAKTKSEKSENGLEPETPHWLPSLDVCAYRLNSTHWIHWTHISQRRGSSGITIQLWMWRFPLILNLQLDQAIRNLTRTHTHLAVVNPVSHPLF